MLMVNTGATVRMTITATEDNAIRAKRRVNLVTQWVSAWTMPSVNWTADNATVFLAFTTKQDK